MEIKTPYIWVNGKIISWEDALDHHLIHTLHYGWGVFEGIRFYETNKWPKIFRLKEHIDRLFYSAWVLDMPLDFNKQEFMDACIDLVKRNEVQNGYIRPIIYYGYGKMGLNPKWAKVEAFISVWKWGKYLADRAIDVKISSIRRIDPRTTDMNAKITGNYTNSILVSNEIHKAGYDEGLLLDTDSFVAEWPGENIFFIKKGEVFTPALGTILPGITRATVIEIFEKKFGIQVKEEKIAPERLWEFEEAFFVGTAAEVTPIGSITDVQDVRFSFSSWEKDSMTTKVARYYDDIVKGKDSDFLHYLS